MTDERPVNVNEVNTDTEVIRGEYMVQVVEEQPKAYGIKKVIPHSEGLSAVYRQWRADSHCRFLHGYSLQFLLFIHCDALDQNGWVYDYGQFKKLKKWLRKTFDHRVIVARDDPEFNRIRKLEKHGVCRVSVMDQVGTEAFAREVMEEMNYLIQQDPSARERGVVCDMVGCTEHEGNTALVNLKRPTKPIAPAGVTLHWRPEGVGNKFSWAAYKVDEGETETNE